jgi:hypothetical protein
MPFPGRHPIIHQDFGDVEARRLGMPRNLKALRQRKLIWHVITDKRINTL